MRYIELKEALKDFVVFSISDIRNVDSNFHRRRLNEWQEKGYIKKILKGCYIFSDVNLNESALFEIANRIYKPSYISLETALSYYNLIPEAVYAITSISTRRTYKFETSIGKFIYKKINPTLFFSYDLLNFQNKVFKIGNIEKVILDYFYLHPDIREKDDFLSLRIDKDAFLAKVNEEELYKFLEKFGKKSLTKRINSFLKFIKNA